MSRVGFSRATSRFVISLSTGWFLGASLSVAAESPPASPARPELRTIADATRGVRQKVDTPPTGASPGDLFVFDQPLLDADGKKELGVNSGYCITTLPGVRSQCQWTLSLPTGTPGCGLMILAAPMADERLLRLGAAAEIALSAA